MSYRNDHDAALARIETLEQELEQLKAVPAPPPPPVHRRVWMYAVAAALVTGASVFGVTARRHREPPPVASAVAPAEPSAPAPDGLRPCLDKVLAARAEGLDARTTDPRGPSPRTIAAAVATGASCRPELAQLASAPGLTATQRAAFQRWLGAEDQLAGDLARIAVYYEHDPYKLDGYTTAAQLWNEFQTDRSARDAVLPAIIRELATPSS